MLYIPFILYGTGKTLDDINNDIIFNFIASIPSNLLLYSVLIFLVVRKRTLLRANIFKLLFENKVVTFLTLLMLIFDFGFLFVMVKAIAYDKVLNNIPSELRIVVILGICLLPIVNFSILMWSMYIIKSGFMKNKKELSEKLYALLDEIKECTDTDKYGNMKGKLNEFNKELESFSQDICQIDKKMQQGGKN